MSGKGRDAIHFKGAFAILDDKLARFYAERLGMKVKGTLSLVLMAFRKGVISDGVEAMKKLRDSGLWISDKLFGDYEI